MSTAKGEGHSSARPHGEMSEGDAAAAAEHAKEKSKERVANEIANACGLLLVAVRRSLPVGSGPLSNFEVHLHHALACMHMRAGHPSLPLFFGAVRTQNRSIEY